MVQRLPPRHFTYDAGITPDHDICPTEANYVWTVNPNSPFQVGPICFRSTTATERPGRHTEPRSRPDDRRDDQLSATNNVRSKMGIRTSRLFAFLVGVEPKLMLGSTVPTDPLNILVRPILVISASAADHIHPMVDLKGETSLSKMLAHTLTTFVRGRGCSFDNVIANKNAVTNQSAFDWLHACRGVAGISGLRYPILIADRLESEFGPPGTAAATDKHRRLSCSILCFILTSICFRSRVRCIPDWQPERRLSDAKGLADGNRFIYPQ